jgi:hypothetical protein
VPHCCRQNAQRSGPTSRSQLTIYSHQHAHDVHQHAACCSCNSQPHAMPRSGIYMMPLTHWWALARGHNGHLGPFIGPSPGLAATVTAFTNVATGGLIPLVVWVLH